MCPQRGQKTVCVYMCVCSGGNVLGVWQANHFGKSLMEGFYTEHVPTFLHVEITFRVNGRTQNDALSQCTVSSVRFEAFPVEKNV